MKKLVIKDSGTIRKKVYSQVRDRILSGEISPHQRLIETKIAQEIGTSRTPVREALHNLEVEGLIESIPRVGYRVKFLNPTEVEEICAIRAAIEEMAADWAMKKAPGKLVAELKKNIAQSEKAIAQGAVKAFVDLDAQFHESIARLSGGQRLLELAQTLRRHMLRYRIESIYTLDNVRRAIDGHKGILRAIEQADREGVGKAIAGHLEQSKKDILQYAFKETNPKFEARNPKQK
jgi:GntR family transcriptional regulator, rspAB operon transcriptional repressor